jgi:integrase
MREFLRRLARLPRTTAPRRLPHPQRSPRAPIQDARDHRKPSQTASRTIARAAVEFQQAQKHNRNVAACLKEIVRQCGSKSPRQLTAFDILSVATSWRDEGYAKHTLSNYSKCLRRFLEWLEEIGAAPLTISKSVPRFNQPQYRTTKATDEEREQLLDAASPRMFFFITICADMGLRHRTATRICIDNFDRSTRILTFTTKGNTVQSLPVPNHIAALINALPDDAPRNEPIVNLLRSKHYGQNQPGKGMSLHRSWVKLKANLGIRPELRVHDLRRTLAEDVWDATKDLRIVQAQLGHRSIATTAKYLANRVLAEDLAPTMLKVEALREQRAILNAKLRERHPPQPERRQG